MERFDMDGENPEPPEPADETTRTCRMIGSTRTGGPRRGHG
jgi:hypothetical protein